MIEIKNGDWKSLATKGLVLLDVWSPSCGPCVRMVPVLESVVAEMSNQLTVLKMDVTESSENMASARALGVMGVPAFFLYKNGSIVEQWTGFKSKDPLLELVRKHV